MRVAPEGIQGRLVGIRTGLAGIDRIKIRAVAVEIAVGVLSVERSLLAVDGRQRAGVGVPIILAGIPHIILHFVTRQGQVELHEPVPSGIELQGAVRLRDRTRHTGLRVLQGVGYRHIRIIARGKHHDGAVAGIIGCL